VNKLHELSLPQKSSKVFATPVRVKNPGTQGHPDMFLNRYDQAK